MPIFYGGGRVAAAIELTVGVLGSGERWRSRHPDMALIDDETTEPDS